MTWNYFEAEALFLDPNDVPRAVEALAAVGCKFEINHDAVDPCGPTVFGRIAGMTELSGHDLFVWLLEIVGPLGDVDEVGFEQHPRRPAA